MKSKEIEIKLKFLGNQLNLFKNWLKKEAKFKEELSITDHYLNNPQHSFFFDSGKSYTDILQFVRIRESNGDAILCHKTRVLDDAGNTLYCDEDEKKLVSVGAGLADFADLGFVEKIVITKKRKTYAWKNFEIALDDVEDLGKFVEFELKGKGGQKEFKKVFDLLKSIGIKKVKKFNRGYVCMKVNPEYDFGQEVVL